MNSDHPGGTGTVLKKNLGQYLVLSDGREIPCAVSSLVHKELVYPTADTRGRRRAVQEVHEIKHTDPIAVGDSVRYRDAGDGTGLILEVLPRRNRLARPASGAGRFEQVLAANVDQVVAVMAAAQPAPKWPLLDRYLVSAESAGLPALVVVTKGDLANGGELSEALAVYEGIGYSVMVTSAADRNGIGALRRALDGKVSVLIGKSGVGKTSLLNALEPGLGLRVREVSRIEKGRHTTTHVEMFALAGGDTNRASGADGAFGAVIDTPGTREFGVWTAGEDDLAELFPEMRPYLGRCRFRAGCRHAEEPGCAVRGAVLGGAIHPKRYRSYLGLLGEIR